MTPREKFEHDNAESVLREAPFLTREEATHFLLVPYGLRPRCGTRHRLRRKMKAAGWEWHLNRWSPLRS